MPSLPPVSDTLKAACSSDLWKPPADCGPAGQHLARLQDRTRLRPSPRLRQWQSATVQNPPAVWGRHAHREVVSRSNHLRNLDTWDTKWRRCSEAAVTGMVTDMLNNGQAIYEMGPTNAVHEDVLMSELGVRLGLPEGCGGVLCHGGTLGNLVALMAAGATWPPNLAWTAGTMACAHSPSPWWFGVERFAASCAMRTIRMGRGSGLGRHQRQAQMDVDDLSAASNRVTTKASRFSQSWRLLHHKRWCLRPSGVHCGHLPTPRALAARRQRPRCIGGVQQRPQTPRSGHRTRRLGGDGLPQNMQGAGWRTGVFYARHADSFLPFSRRGIPAGTLRGFGLVGHGQARR